MNLEHEIKHIFRIFERQGDTEYAISMIQKISTFQKEDIINAIRYGGRKASEKYAKLEELNKKRKEENQKIGNKQT